MTPKEKAVDNYIREKHNQDECIGFIDGYTQCQEDMADELKKIEEQKIRLLNFIKDLSILYPLNKQD